QLALRSSRGVEGVAGRLARVTSLFPADRQGRAVAALVLFEGEGERAKVLLPLLLAHPLADDRAEPIVIRLDPDARVTPDDPHEPRHLEAPHVLESRRRPCAAQRDEQR